MTESAEVSVLHAVKPYTLRSRIRITASDIPPAKKKTTVSKPTLLLAYPISPKYLKVGPWDLTPYAAACFLFQKDMWADATQPAWASVLHWHRTQDIQPQYSANHSCQED